MREILFRAKAINRIPGREYRTKYNNGDWVYGLLEKPRYPEFPELPAEMRNADGVSGIEVDFDTIGQHTGLKDVDGNKIFEGDIVLVLYRDEIYAVKWDECKAEFYYENDYGSEEAGTEILVVGNIYDDPELLGGDTDA